MKLFSIFLAMAAFYGCQSVSTTEINRPSPDVNGTRQLILRTSVTSDFTTASASYSDGTTQGFGSGVLIQCNGTTVVDTRKSDFENDTSVEIFFSDSSYDWMYQGPDTTFEFVEPSLGTIEIQSPEGVVFLPDFDSITIDYTPMNPCSGIGVILSSEENELVFTPTVRFDSLTGAITPIPVDSLTSLEGDGFISLTIGRRTEFSMPSIHSILIEDSTISQEQEVDWQQ